MIRDHAPYSSPPRPHAGYRRVVASSEGWGEGEGGKVHQLFSDKLNAMTEELNETLAT